MSNKKRWDVSKRFLKHSEAIFGLTSNEVEALIQLYLKSLKELLPSIEVMYFWGERCFQLEKNKLVEQAPPVENAFEAILEVRPPLGPVPGHKVGYNNQKLSEPKLHYLDLITQVYQSKLADSLPRPPLEILEREPPSQFQQQKSKNLRARYRQQKEVILAIDRFAKKQNPGLLKDIQELPELEQEIINFQNQLLSDLDQARSKLRAAEEKSEARNLFFGKVLDELSNKLRINLGLLDLSAGEKHRVSAEFSPVLLVVGRLKNIVELCETLADSLEAKLHLSPLRLERFTGLDLVHQALSDFSRAEGAKSCTFQFNQTLGNCKIEGDQNLLAFGLSHFFQFVTALQEYESERGALDFKIKGKVLESQTELQVEVEGLTVSKGSQALVIESKSFYECAEVGLLSPLLMQQLVSKAFERHGGRMALLWRENGRLDCRIRIGRPDQT